MEVNEISIIIYHLYIDDMDTLIAILSAVSLAELAGLITAIVMLRPNRRKGMEEAQRLHAEARQAEIENEERMSAILMTNIVAPLQAELKSLRETVDRLKDQVERLSKEVDRLKRAVNKANTCQHKEGCPVLEKLREEKEEQ